jgi:hypothetical protein
MSTAMQKVEEAAAMLDSKVGSVSWLTADWRSKIDTVKLNMSSIKLCILGQLAGGYSKGMNELEAWGKHEGAFCDHKNAWIEYLTRTKEPWTVGTILWGKYNLKKYKVRGYVDGHVIMKDSDGDLEIRTIQHVKDSWLTEDPNKLKYNKGDLLTGDKGTILIVGDMVDGERRAVRVTGWGSWSSLDSYLDGTCCPGETFTLVKNMSNIMSKAGLTI